MELYVILEAYKVAITHPIVIKTHSGYFLMIITSCKLIFFPPLSARMLTYYFLREKNYHQAILLILVEMHLINHFLLLLELN